MKVTAVEARVSRTDYGVVVSTATYSSPGRILIRRNGRSLEFEPASVEVELGPDGSEFLRVPMGGGGCILLHRSDSPVVAALISDAARHIRRALDSVPDIRPVSWDASTIALWEEGSR